jgi:hypothetical protein
MLSELLVALLNKLQMYKRVYTSQIYDGRCYLLIYFIISKILIYFKTFQKKFEP